MSRPTPIKIGQLEIRFHRHPADTDASFSVFESTIPPGAHVPAPHSHVGYDETVFGLTGICHFTVAGKEVALAPGEMLFVPRGVVHSFINRGNETTRVLVIVSPGLLGPEYFHEVAAVVNAGGPPDRARLAEIMLRHGMVPATTPPLAAAS